MSTVRWGTSQGRAVIAAAALGSGLTLLDGTVVNVALPTIGADLDASLSQLQWVVNGYFLSLASLILLGGSLGDRYGRRRVFVVGTLWFAAASLLCGLAPTAEVLIAARVLQGIGGALLTPGSLAMIQGAFVTEDRGRAIGAWSGVSGIATAVGPLVGGLLIDHASWRWIFLINLPLAVLTVVLTRWVPETRDPRALGRFDVSGASLATLSLAAVTFALIEWEGGLMPLAAATGLAGAVAFVVRERRAREPMVPLGLFDDRTFSAANAMTLVVYAALGALMFFLVIELQTVGGYGALEAGVATLPVTVCMLLLASRGGALGQRIGPRVPMTVGPLVMAAGTLLLLAVGPDVNWWRDVLPGLTVFGLGLALMVAPLTATVLAAAPDDRAGIASGINNAVARAGSLLAVAALPVAVGLSGEDYRDPTAFQSSYTSAMLACAGLLALGGVLSWVLIPQRLPEPA
ncbi:DHA2 family efflux MFS transporter permease subunit [Nocardioides seonyuensis]|uniref:DHA2 family efflux MFS transporter permease subunit n=1 Tax=Nocardioides seonyuensis TaxID=2518371 RepID=A0A4P7IFH0_9ACTN|nr:MFS transporter [Nocardioides seonyuensis]QBX55333.1 DHA2 family efflux MFS transporter permease subunit [Nocardioides seonyuensis]